MRINVINQGAVVVNSVVVVAQAPNIVCAEVGLGSKHASIAATGVGFHSAPFVWLEADEHTLKIDESRSGKLTMIEFLEFAGWTVFSADIARYTLRVVFVRGES